MGVLFTNVINIIINLLSEEMVNILLYSIRTTLLHHNNGGINSCDVN